MKKRQIFFAITVLIALAFSNFTINQGAHIESLFKGKKILSTYNIKNQITQTDTAKILFFTPPIKCGSIKWKDSVISNWLTNYCTDKCNDSLSSGYKFSGVINNSDRSWSMKVIIKTDKEYAQPVRFDPLSGKFNGNVYFDKSNRLETPIMIMLRDSDNVVIHSYIITLIE